MEIEEEVARHLLGDSLLKALNPQICGHKGHDPFAFGRRIKEGGNECVCGMYVGP